MGYDFRLLNGKQNKTNRTCFDNPIRRLTYEKELLNFRKNSDFYRTNHFQLYRVGPPASTTRETVRQADVTNRTWSGVRRS